MMKQGHDSSAKYDTKYLHCYIIWIQLAK